MASSRLSRPTHLDRPASCLMGTGLIPSWVERPASWAERPSAPMQIGVAMGTLLWWSGMLTLFSMAGTVLSGIILVVTDWSPDSFFHSSEAVQALLWAILATTIVSVLLCWKFNSLKWQDCWARNFRIGRVSHERIGLAQSPPSVKITVVVETVILLLIPPPVMGISQKTLCGLCMLTWLRAWFLLRLLRDTNAEQRGAVQQRRILGSRGAHQRVAPTFALKTTFHRHPWGLLSCLFSVGFISSALFVWAAERYEQPDEFNLWDSLWFVGVTMTTVGYGDIHPETFVGKVGALFACIYGIVTIALLVTTVTNEFHLSPKERYLMNSIQLGAAVRGEMDAAARYIQYMWREGRRRPVARRGPTQVTQQVRMSSRIPQLRKRLWYFRNRRFCLQDEIRVHDFQWDVSLRLEQMAVNQEAILSRLAGIEAALRRNSACGAST